MIGRSKATLNPTLGVSASLGADVKLSKNFTLFAEVRVQAYTITVKEIKFKEFKQTAIIRILGGAPIPAPDGLLPFPSTINNVSEAPEYLKHIVFRKELNEESNTARYGTKSFFPGGDLLGSIFTISFTSNDSFSEFIMLSLSVSDANSLLLRYSMIAAFSARSKLEVSVSFSSFTNIDISDV